VGKINMFLMNKENETIMTDALSYLAIFFVMFSVIAAEAWLKEGEERGKEVCAWAFLGIWLIIGFGVASWLIGVLFHVGFRLAELICEKTHLPVFLDPSHGTGRWSLVGPVALAGIAAGADGLMIEVHPQPDLALSDGEQSLNFEHFAELMGKLEPVAKAVGRKMI